MNSVGSKDGGVFAVCNRGSGDKGRVGFTICVGGGDTVTQRQHLVKVSASDVQLCIGEDLPVIYDGGGVFYQQVWSGRRERGRGAPEVAITVAVVLVPIAVFPVFVPFNSVQVRTYSSIKVVRYFNISTCQS